MAANQAWGFPHLIGMFVGSDAINKGLERSIPLNPGGLREGEQT